MGQADILPLILSYLDIELPQSIMGANYINGEKVVYRQNGLIGENKVLEENIYDMDTITKVIVNVGDVTKDE